MGGSPSLIALFSVRLLRCTGADTMEALTIWPPHGQVAPALQMGVEGIEQRLDETRLGELLAIQPNSRRVRDPILEAQAQEAHEREPVADLILDLIVREVVERL